MVTQIFLSHTKFDQEFCNKFGVIASLVGVKLFRSEFENIKPPAWTTIREQMFVSRAMFLLVGQHLAGFQELAHTDKQLGEMWEYTQNWIAYEIGLACARKMDVWVFYDHEVNKMTFPVPYLNNFASHKIDIEDQKSVEWLKSIFLTYRAGKRYDIMYDTNLVERCPNCGMVFNCHTDFKTGIKVCPSCLKAFNFQNIK